MDISLENLIRQSVGVASGLGETQKKIEELTTFSGNLAGEKVGAARNAAEAAEVKATTEFDEVARQEQTRKGIASRMGTDASKAGWVIGKSADTIREADAQLDAIGETIRQKKTVAFLDNPIGWFAAQLTVNDDIENYNHFARLKNRAEETAKTAETMTQTSYITNNALSETATEQYKGAAKILAAHQFNVQAIDAAAQGARWNMEGVIASSNISRERLQVLYSANNAIMQEKQFQNELTRLRLSQAEFGLRQESFALQKEAHLEKNHEDSLIKKYIQDGYFSLTGKQMDATSSAQALILYKSKQPDVMAYFNSGLQSSAVTGNTSSKPVISLSPFDASTLVGQGKVTNMSPAMGQVGEQLITWRRAFENPAIQNKYPYDAKDKHSKEVAFNKYVEDQKAGALAAPSADGIFAPFPIEKVARVNKMIGNLPVWKNVLEPAAKTGVDLNDPNLVFGLLTNGMREGKLSYVDAVDISLVYAAGLDMNNQTRNFLAFGISPVKTYNAQISISGTQGKTQVNLVDQKTIATALNKAEAVRASSKLTQGRSETPFLPN